MMGNNLLDHAQEPSNSYPKSMQSCTTQANSIKAGSGFERNGAVAAPWVPQEVVPVHQWNLPAELVGAPD